jgi:hypothetical protein
MHAVDSMSKCRRRNQQQWQQKQWAPTGGVLLQHVHLGGMQCLSLELQLGAGGEGGTPHELLWLPTGFQARHEPCNTDSHTYWRCMLTASAAVLSAGSVQE